MLPSGRSPPAPASHPALPAPTRQNPPFHVCVVGLNLRHVSPARFPEIKQRKIKVTILFLPQRLSHPELGELGTMLSAPPGPSAHCQQRQDAASVISQLSGWEGTLPGRSPSVYTPPCISLPRCSHSIACSAVCLLQGAAKEGKGCRHQLLVPPKL